jgi:fibronectin-binding autotransporter adhesin
LSGGGVVNVLAGAALTVSGAIGGSGGLAKNGGGLLVLSGSNTFGGATTINAGTLEIGAGGATGTLGSGAVIDNGTLAFDRTDNYGGPVSATISGTGGLALSAGTLALPVANTYAGVTNIDGGVLNAGVLAGINTASSIGAGSVAGSAADLAFGGGTFQYTGTSPASTNRLFTIGDANGDSAVIDSSAASASDTLSFTGSGSIALVNAATHTLTLTGSNTGSNTFTPVIGNFSPAYPTSLIKTGPGTWTIGSVNTFTGGVTIQAGTLKLGVPEALGNAINALTLGNSVTNTGGTLDLNGETQILTMLASVGSGQNIVTNSSTTPATLQFDGAGVWGGGIQDGASAGNVLVTIYSGASATFTGANTYTGQTLIQNATLILAGTGSTLSSVDRVELNNGAGTGGVLELGNATLGGVNQTLGALIIGAGAANRVISGNATQTSTLTINNSAADAFPGYLGTGTADTNMVTTANDLALTKTGSGTFTLGGSATTTVSTYDGGTNINQGTLALGIANALPAANTLTFGSGTLTSGAVNINGGTLDLAGFSSVAGAVTLASGSIVDSVGGGVLSGSSYLVQSGAVSAALGGGGSALTKTTSGTVTLSGANTYTGATVVSAGAIVVSGSISGTSGVTVGGGTSPAALTANGSITSSGGVNLASDGSLSGTGTINGGVTATAGSTLAPGLSSAGLTIEGGALTLEAGSTLELSLSNSNAGAGGAPALTDYSKLTLGAGVSATLDGTLAINVTGTLNHLDLFTIILSGTQVSGEFTNTTQVSGTTYAFSSGGENFEINYAYDGSPITSRSQFQAITGGSEVAVLVMPEPNSGAMLVGSLGVALGLQRFRRRKF